MKPRAQLTEDPAAAGIPVDPQRTAAAGVLDDEVPILGWEEEQWETLDQYWDEPEDEEIEESE